MSSYKPPQDYSRVHDETDSYDTEPNGIMLKPVLLNPLLTSSITSQSLSLNQPNENSKQLQPPYPPHVSNQQSFTAQVTQPTAFTRAPLAPIPYAGASIVSAPKRPPPIGTGKWADDICDWPSNIYPSCFCVCCVFDGIWIGAQMAQKTGFATFQNVLYCYVIAWILGMILQSVLGPFFLLMPLLFTITFSIFLRLHIVRKYGITEAPACGECCCGFCCYSCSVAQMARHVYGYTKLIDGDGDWERKDNYGGPALTV